VSGGERLRRSLIWHVVTGLLRVLFSLSCRIRVVAYEPLPKGRGYLLVANHISHFDPPIIGTYIGARVEWVAMAELFHGPVLQALFSGLGVIPVDRMGTDRGAVRAAFREAARRLKEGRVIGIFPEGGIRDGAASIINGAEMKEGAMSLALIAGAPVLPCVILGSERLYNRRRWLPWRKAPIWVAHGGLVEVPAGEDARTRLKEMVAQEIMRLKDRLREDFRLSDEDMPHSPQQRMAEP